MQLDIDEAAVPILKEVLESARGELLYEISNTDRREYREGLRVKQTVLESVLKQLG